MSKRIVLVILLCLLLSASTHLFGQPTTSTPLAFEVNVGQAPAGVRFLAQGRGYSVVLTPQEAILQLGENYVQWALSGANPEPRITGLESQPGKTNYFKGSNPTRWKTNIPNFAKVKYENVYPGIDLVYYGDQQHLEYDFLVGPGANVRSILVDSPGARIDRTGDLVVDNVRWHKPVLYQEVKGTRKQISGGFEPRGHGQIGFRTGPYDRSLPLVIDPYLTTAFATYLGGPQQDSAPAIGVDGSGNVYVAGWTRGQHAPTDKPFPSTSADGPEDVFVAKFSPAGALLYSTYVGGAGRDFAWGMAVDSSGNVYVTGESMSGDFPAVHSIRTFPAGSTHVFVFKLDPTGANLLYSTQFGGTTQPSNPSALAQQDVGWAIAIDAAGSAYIGGQTTSTDFPVTGGFQPASAGSSDGFVAKLTATGDALVYSTYFGGKSNDAIKGIQLDSAGNAYVAGSTSSPDLPVKNPYQSALKNSQTTGFVAKINAPGSALVYSTYLGGSVNDGCFGIAVDSAGSAYITGQTASSDFPATTRFVASDRVPPVVHVFITKFAPTGSSLSYSAILGGNGGESAYAIAVDNTGSASVTGITGSTDFPLASPLNQSATTYPSGSMFISRLTPDGGTLSLSSYFGGPPVSFGVAAAAIAVDAAGNTYVSGITTSTTFPTVNAIQPRFAGSFDGFAAKFTLTPGGNPVPTLSSLLPASTDINGPGFSLQVDGSNFQSGSSVLWNGSPLATTYLSSAQLTASVPAALLLQPGPMSVIVFTPGPGGGTSPSFRFTVLGSLLPTLAQVLPNDLTAGGPAATLSVAGTQLTPASVVQWNGTPLPTTFIDANHLTAAVPASLLATPGTAKITIYTAPPGGGTSVSLPFVVLPPPAVDAGGILGAATYQPSIVPGALASLFGRNFSAPLVSYASFALPYPTSLGGVSVTLNGMLAPLVYVGPGQINFQVPWELQGKTASVVVTANGIAAAPQTANVAALAPGIFTLNQMGTGQAAAILAGTRNVACNPANVPPFTICVSAKKGDTVEFFLNGLGPVSNQPASGAAASSNPLSPTLATPTATLGGVAAPITYSGLAPNFVGLYQVNVQVPQNAPAGDAVPLVLTVGTIVANTVTIAIQ